MSLSRGILGDRTLIFFTTIDNTLSHGPQQQCQEHKWESMVPLRSAERQAVHLYMKERTWTSVLYQVRIQEIWIKT